MIKLEIINKHHEDYQKACQLAEQVYKEKLGMRYPSFPVRVIVAYNNNQIVGSIGITIGSDEKLGIEKFISNIQLDRSEIAEVNRLNITDGYQYLSKYLIATTAVYAHSIGVKEIYITAHAGIRLVLRRMNIPSKFLSDVDISDYQVQGGEKYRKLKPQCHKVITRDIFEISKIVLLSPLSSQNNEAIIWGESLSSILKI